MSPWQTSCLPTFAYLKCLPHCSEAEFLLKLHHSSIVECYDVVDNGKQMVLVMEYLRGGPLLDDLHHIAGESYTEQQAAVIAAQVLHCFAIYFRPGMS